MVSFKNRIPTIVFLILIISCFLTPDARAGELTGGSGIAVGQVDLNSTNVNESVFLVPINQTAPKFRVPTKFFQKNGLLDAAKLPSEPPSRCFKNVNYVYGRGPTTPENQEQTRVKLTLIQAKPIDDQKTYLNAEYSYIYPHSELYPLELQFFINEYTPQNQCPEAIPQISAHKIRQGTVELTPYSNLVFFGNPVGKSTFQDSQTKILVENILFRPKQSLDSLRAISAGEGNYQPPHACFDDVRIKHGRLGGALMEHSGKVSLRYKEFSPETQKVILDYVLIYYGISSSEEPEYIEIEAKQTQLEPCYNMADLYESQGSPDQIATLGDGINLLSSTVYLTDHEMVQGIQKRNQYSKEERPGPGLIDEGDKYNGDIERLESPEVNLKPVGPGEPEDSGGQDSPPTVGSLDSQQVGAGPSAPRPAEDTEPVPDGLAQEVEQAFSGGACRLDKYGNSSKISWIFLFPIMVLLILRSTDKKSRKEGS